MTAVHFADRREAGTQLAERLREADLEAPILVALPRGGVPVAYEAARLVEAPLDVLVTRKIGHPMQPELGIGAIAEGGRALFDEDMLRRTGLSAEDLQEAEGREREELERRVTEYRQHAPALPVRDRTVVLVDDGLATGVTARAALQALADQGAARRVLAVPVCAPESAARLAEHADEVVCLYRPRAFRAVGQAYANFEQVSDEVVVDLLERARREAR